MYRTTTGLCPADRDERDCGRRFQGRLLVSFWQPLQCAPRSPVHSGSLDIPIACASGVFAVTSTRWRHEHAAVQSVALQFFRPTAT